MAHQAGGAGGIVSFTVTVLGSSGMYATIERACAGYLIDTGEGQILLDCGAGTWRNLLTHTDYRSLTGVMLTHRHPDHVTDLFQLFHARRYGPDGRLPEIPLWAPAETLERITAFSKELDESFQLNSISPGDSVEVAGARFSYHSMAHPPDTLGVRISKDGGVLGYSSDTGPDGDVGGVAAEADVFLCEATLQDSDETWEGHMSASQAGAAGEAAGAKRLVLTHLPPGRDAGLSLTEAYKTSGDCEVQIATDGLKIKVGS